MDFEELSGKTDDAINKLLDLDSELFTADVSEWAISHRLAVYMESLFQRWSIDCEYNRVGFNGSPKSDAEGAYKRPDIIIHHRGRTEKEHNLLMIEVKINNSSEDDVKLREFTSPPHHNRNVQYQYGLALSFKPHLKTKWFSAP